MCVHCGICLVSLRDISQAINQYFVEIFKRNSSPKNEKSVILNTALTCVLFPSLMKPYNKFVCGIYTSNL